MEGIGSDELQLQCGMLFGGYLKEDVRKVYLGQMITSFFILIFKVLLISVEYCIDEW